VRGAPVPDVVTGLKQDALMDVVRGDEVILAGSLAPASIR
jgi:hypothetical protein